jgi:hypothetical protein
MSEMEKKKERRAEQEEAQRIKNEADDEELRKLRR